ncbi:MAG: TRAP transporter large permease [Planctomycetota bacterium]|jgi:tripartite ATP-independent transporter DctM subunit|nr:TRAP transporter large permease [Planctomycetota bacterium]
MEANIPGCAALLGSFAVLVAIRLPITFALVGSSLIAGLAIGLPLEAVWQRMIQGVQSFSLLAVPFFILAGEIMLSGGIAQRLVDFSDVIIGRIRGGMAQVNILSSTFFGAVSGSTTADVSSIGATLIPVMVKQGYGRDFSVSVTVTSACQSMIIPPSHNMIIYALAAGGVSAGRLFLAGMVPGCLLGLSLMAVAHVQTLRHGYPRGKAYTFREALIVTKDSLLGLMTIVIILVGVTSGYFTATESAAIACAYAFAVTFLIYRNIPFAAIWEILYRAGKTLAMVLSIIAAANGFGYLLSYLRIPGMATAWMLATTDNPALLLLMINALLLFLGCIMDVAPLIMIVTPIVMPVIKSIGMDPVHFGIVLLLNLAVGACTPPVGLTLFTGCAVGRIPVEKVMLSILPFYAAMAATLLLVTYIPPLAMSLPNAFMP